MSEQPSAERVIRDLIWIDSDRMSGKPCLLGTRIPIKTIWDYLEGDGGLEEFFVAFPQVPRERVFGMLDLARDSFIQQIQAA
jgi:uncharacterized protein (DUF433 family)